MIELVAEICLGVLSLAAALCLVRIVRGPSLAERIVASDTLVLVVVAGLATMLTGTGSRLEVSLLVVVALVGFVGTSFLARFLESDESPHG